MFNIVFNFVYKTTLHPFCSPFSTGNTFGASLTSSFVYLELNGIFLPNHSTSSTDTTFLFLGLEAKRGSTPEAQ